MDHCSHGCDLLKPCLECENAEMRVDIAKLEERIDALQEENAALRAASVRQHDAARTAVEAFAGNGPPPHLRLTVREHARRRGTLGGADAQALEGALAMTERERDEARAEVERRKARCIALENECASLEASAVAARVAKRVREEERDEARAEVGRLRAEVAAAREAGVRAGLEAAARECDVRHTKKHGERS